MQERFQTPQSFAFLAAAFEGGLAMLAMGLGWLLNTPPLETFRWLWPDVAWGVLATLPPLGLLWFCLASRWRPLRNIVEVVDGLLGAAVCQLPLARVRRDRHAGRVG